MTRQPLALCLATIAVVAVSGCGSSDDAVESRIARERGEAASQARQEQKVKDLEAKLRDVERRAAKTKTKTVVERQASASTPARSDSGGGTSSGSSETFHVPSGNVSCRITTSSARCSVARTGTSFSFSAGSGSASTGGEFLSRGSGYQTGWGTTVSAGSVSCRIPTENEKAGIRCSDSSTGHGFEASAVAERQRLF